MLACLLLLEHYFQLLLFYTFTEHVFCLQMNLASVQLAGSLSRFRRIVRLLRALQFSGSAVLVCKKTMNFISALQ